ncbi:TMEM175 family protein [Luteimicrobium subarcticum]|uniref:Putative membrane protein n=1 Tax=Luteimicrobium subarcticum TaxID=620910 RepID=A0A2M8W748_9MICO|nr:TMEM175 family protein [Luteimicrobium subarcticum]PJI86757.1 putative membrane protein [Luteimicrobium subarcticum]
MSAGGGGADDEVAADDTGTGGERGLERLLVFGDAVVAIAITLVVLPLVDAAQDLDDRTAWQFVQDHRAGLGAAALSFLVIWVLWRPQHRVFERAHGYTPRTATLHVVWLAAVVVLPLPTLLVVEAPHGDRSAPVLYIGTVLVALVAGRLEYADLWRSGKLDGRAPTARSWATPAAAALALVLAATVPGVGMWGMLLLVPAGLVEDRISRPAR